MSKYFNKHEENKDKANKEIAAKIRSEEYVPWKVIASRIYNERNNPVETVNNSSDYVNL